jgi:hypothetical protein
MKKSELARAIARQHKMKTGDAADQVDRAVTRIIRTLRRGNIARLPGLGTITPGKPWTFEPETFEPKTFEPETFQPETFGPESLEPETFEPETPVQKPGAAAGKRR